MSYENLSLLRTDELRTVRRSKREFKKELSFVKEASDLFLETFGVLSNQNVQAFSNSKDACYRISYRIFRVARCAFKSSLEGYYDVSFALLRIAYENHLLMTYLTKNEKEAELWFRGKKFKPKFIREKVSYADDSLYKEMSEFIHSSFRSTLAFTEVERGKTKATLGEYSKESLGNMLLLILMTITTTIIWLSSTFAEIMDNEEWRSSFRKTVPKIWKHLKKRNIKS